MHRLAYTVVIDPREQLVAVMMAPYRSFNVPLLQQFQTLVYLSIAD